MVAFFRREPAPGDNQWNLSRRPRQYMIEVECDDGRLVAAARRGDEDAFARLYATHHPPVYRYALHMCGAAMADDIVQDTFLALLRETNGFDAARGPLIAYLFGIARHYILKALALSRFESSMGDEESGRDGLVAEGGTAFEDVSRTETIASVRGAIRSLPLVYREVVVLCELQELDYAAAAAIIECPVGTVRSRLHRARALLVSKLASMQPVGCKTVPGRTRGSAPATHVRDGSEGER